MVDHSLGTALRCLVNGSAIRSLHGVPDGELLGRFIATHDELAFSALMQRHGPMVLGVCRRSLSRHDAEDACQATFLVLARKATTLRREPSLGGWLHNVAVRVASSLKRDLTRRAFHERQTVPRTPPEEITWSEGQSILDAELGRLPPKYRDPLILCYLECLTRDDAASRLGLSSGALHGRLERGRELLKDRLTRRGLTLSAAMIATSLSQVKAMPPGLVAASARAALAFATGNPLIGIGENVLALTREVLFQMSMTKLKLGAGVLLAALAAFSLLPSGTAQDAKPGKAVEGLPTENDEAFIRRMSRDLRGSDPTPAEIHLFATHPAKDKRHQLIDLFIKERQGKAAVDFAKKDAAVFQYLDSINYSANLNKPPPARPEAMLDPFESQPQKDKAKRSIAELSQAHLDRLFEFVKTYPDSPEAEIAIRQIALLFEAHGKDAEAKVWRSRLKESPKPNLPQNRRSNGTGSEKPAKPSEN